MDKLKICQDFAIKEYNGLCLATEYKNNKTKMLWQCEKGHQWEAVWAHIQNKHWCPECNGSIKYTIEKVREFVTSIGYELISTEYINNLTPLEIKCDKGHIFYPNLNNLKDKQRRCSTCAYIKKALNQRLSFTEVKEFIESIGYELISTKYEGTHFPLEIKCNKGHIFYPEFNSLKSQGSRCPQCASGKSERRCREIFELIYNKSFPLYSFKNEYGQKFIWDGYNEELKIAFEYDGYQHYHYPNAFHKTEDDFLLQQISDHYKEKYAKENGITLYVIPYTENNDLEEYIMEITQEKRLK